MFRRKEEEGCGCRRDGLRVEREAPGRPARRPPILQTLPSRRTDAARSASPATGAYKVDISRGERIGRVSSEWFSRPDDERYLSLGALHAAVRARAERATARTVETKALRVEASRDDAEHLTLIVPGQAPWH